MCDLPFYYEFSGNSLRNGDSGNLYELA
uniref:Uncharacterized protein n=1 Tax=Arundo donax TaxID=35708 RepID=A0A0A8ZYP5_ARUDO